MSFMNIFRKKNPIEYKQPQEDYCSNFECLNEIGSLTDQYILLDNYGIKYSNNYCINCITEGKINDK